MQLILVYITTKDKTQAEQIGKKLVEEKLVGCVNILDGMKSIYWWNDAIQEDSEAILLAKTDQNLLPGLISRVKQLHSYSCPCIIALPIIEGNPDYLKWLKQQIHCSENPDR
ncbi:MAG TPA: divalent-cation tolerance protein CutA [Chitinispirillaceae bacterium]|nr:divalent-cation tolerance protein CutA [Chitinispirillaceae bacterium]